MESKTLNEVYLEFTKGLRIYPGMWRPRAAWEQVAWVSPPWAEGGYAWLDFPEVIIQGRELEFLYAGHGPIGHPSVHHGNLPKAPWYSIENGIGFDRVLPGGLAFGGSLVRQNESVVHMSLYLKNGTPNPLPGLKTQTCVYLRELEGFGERTWDNKYIHVPQRGWIVLTEAKQIKDEIGKYRFGWRGGPAIADRPFMLVTSSEPQRLIAMTWHEDTYSLISNPAHPCMHADPAWPDLAPGQKHTINGKLIFFEGTLTDFEKVAFFEAADRYGNN